MTRSKKQAQRDRDDAKWSKAVRERDGYSCRRCRRWDPAVQAHHIHSKKQRPDLRHELDNGVSLCPACHRHVHLNPDESKREGYMGTESYELAMSRRGASVSSHQPRRR